MSNPSMFDTESPSVFVVLAEPSPEQEADFHDWYDKIHGPDALENGSFRALHRYRAAGPGWTQARYLAVWQGRYLSEPEAGLHPSPGQGLAGRGPGRRGGERGVGPHDVGRARLRPGQRAAGAGGAGEVVDHGAERLAAA
jgi:hypothetical protein